MLFEHQLEQLLHEFQQSGRSAEPSMQRLRAEIDFAKQFSELFPDRRAEWEQLILKAANSVSAALSASACADLHEAVKHAEEIMAPIGKAAKEYTIHCCGHAHIDMNWMWPWPETVNVSHDTFLTVDTLMDEFPEFKFSQSQASTYIAMEEFCPEVFDMICRRVKEGRWDVTASMWVEGDKNIVSGESLCRHLLYTRAYFKEKMGLQPEDVKIDWSPDTFGHAHTIPSIVSRGGVSRYYFCRTGPGPWLFRWRSPDGSEILAYNDKGGYNGTIDPDAMRWLMCGFVKETGLKDFMFLYGVGDHGGGPTRRDLRKALEIMQWPIFPTVKLSTTDDFYSAVEKAKPNLPVIDKDLNFTFEGCYTAQSNIKRANRFSEILLPEAETLSVLAGAVGGMEYPGTMLLKGWRYTLFNHFHDILPGSGVHATYEYSQGLFQEIQAMAGAIRARALRGLCSKIDTASVAEACPGGICGGTGDGLGAGAGDPGVPGGVTARGAGATSAEPFVVYNALSWPRSEMVFAKVWNKKLPDDRIVVRDSSGKQMKGQVVGRGNYWGHEFATIAFRAEDVPAIGYKVYAVDVAATPVEGHGAWISRSFPEGTESMIPEINDSGVLENDYLKVVVDFPSGAIAHLIDKETGFDYVPQGELLGLLEGYIEAPHGMTSWVIGQTPQVTEMVSGGSLDIVHRGPNRVAVRSNRVWRDSRISVEIGLDAGSRTVDFRLQTRWVERGTPETGVPMLKVAFPVNVQDGVPTYEIPFGSQQRVQSVQEIPALKWADLSGVTPSGPMGITLLNDCKYGHSCVDNTLRLTLLRSSYDPDPLPEIADHDIRYAVIAHRGGLNVIDATRAGEQFNSQMPAVNATVQKGKLPAEKSFVESLTPNVFLSAVKKAEDSKAIVVRLFEAAGKETTAKVRLGDLVKPTAKAVETDVLERPLSKSSARLEDGVLSVTVPAYGQATVMIG